MEKKHIPYGSIVSWIVPPKELGFPKNFFNVCQNFFTKKPQTHSSIIMDRQMYFLDDGKLEKTDVYYEFEASETVRITVFERNKNARVYAIKAPREILEQALNEILRENYGKPYAIVQTFYFIFRWFFELFRFDVRRWWNPLGWLFLICSELVYIFIKRVAELMKWYDLTNYLNRWKKDNVHSGDIDTIIQWMIEHRYSEEVVD